MCAKKRFSAKGLDSFYERSSYSTQALSTQFLFRPDRKESNLTFPADWRTKVHSCAKKKFLAKRLDFSYERSSYSGTFSCNGSDTGSATETGGKPLARYDRYKMDYTLVSRAIIQRKSVTDAQQCARECDLHRSVYECQAFAFT